MILPGLLTGALLRGDYQLAKARGLFGSLASVCSFDRERITSVDWRSYPIARFPAAPVVSVEVIERKNDPPVGAGEAAQGPAAAAIANAVFAATGARLRELPLRPQRVRAALSGTSSA